MVSAIDRLFDSPPFPRSDGGLFVPALRECARIQSRRFPILAKFYALEDFKPDFLRRAADVPRLPGLYINVFKEFDFKPSAPFNAALELTSSGTSGQKSRIVLDKGSLRRVKQSAESVYAALGMTDKTLKTNYFCLTYDPGKAKNLGTAFTDELLTGFAAPVEKYYAIQWSQTENRFRFELEVP